MDRQVSEQSSPSERGQTSVPLSEAGSGQETSANEEIISNMLTRVNELIKQKRLQDALEKCDTGM
ncbi:hypothetical protein DPMN_034490 [Dreissena polymorpha]|uniref:Uncharacterized protein n=1 Tax=Dreissena polymorpha TaxID=45954 RepID=A0A9D4M7M7_DREPO|nr:hypothetical protein DPMN_034490 [Dreissena polymorpha]